MRPSFQSRAEDPVVAGFWLSSNTVWSPGHSSRTSSQTAILTGRLAPELRYSDLCRAVRVDVTAPDSAVAMCAAVRDRWGRVDVLVNTHAYQPSAVQIAAGAARGAALVVRWCGSLVSRTNREFLYALHSPPGRDRP
jgi:hypothetical protein